jgi:hypothetical protein
MSKTFDFYPSTSCTMVGAGIHPGDTLVVDRAEKPTDRSVIVAMLNGEFTSKRMRKKIEWLKRERARATWSSMGIGEEGIRVATLSNLDPLIFLIIVLESCIIKKGLPLHPPVFSRQDISILTSSRP